MSKKYLDLDGLEEVVEQINAKYAKTTDIPTTPSEVGALPSSTKYGASVTASVNTSTYVCTFQLKDQDGNNLGSPVTIDLPIESAIVNASYDNTTKDLTFTLQSGSTITVPIDDIIGGLQEELVSGTNIKTVNGVSILGSGDIDANDVKEITTPTGIWELADGVYKGDRSNFLYQTNDAIGSAGANTIVLVYTTNAYGGTVTKQYIAFINAGTAQYIIFGDASSSGVGRRNSKSIGELVSTSDVVNNLTSTSTTAPLSANMGKTLKDTIDDMPDTAITTAEIEALF